MSIAVAPVVAFCVVGVVIAVDCGAVVAIIFVSGILAATLSITSAGAVVVVPS